MWDLDVNRMYVPLNVGKHWISMCVNFVTRSIEVFDCEGLRHPGAVEPFAVLISRIVKAVQSFKSHLDFSLVNDNNIREARQKIAYDLWKAAIDPVLIERMAKFTPPKTISSALVKLE
ncbi:hypothetical protein F2Q68_00043152 [Brassica cretica]|nr:hypothetical protein F2Q68_00043152 [Brassica cretica]